MINALKNPSFFRPMSRPSSPAPAPVPVQAEMALSDKPAHPLNKLSLNNFRRPSPAPTPVPAATPSLIQDGTYLEMLSLKFSEAVSKALAQPTGPANPGDLLSGKRPLPAGRGSTLGAVIASELNAARGNAHLHRAIIRSLHRPLSVLLSNLSSILLPLLASPAFLTPKAPTPQLPNPNATQIHALGIAKFAEELLDVFDRLELGTDSDPRGDGLKAVREGLVSLINKVTTPLIMGIRNELVALVEALEVPARITLAPKSTVVYHPSITTLQTVMPLYAKALARYASSTFAQSTLASLLILVLFKGMVALAHRPDFGPSHPPSPVVMSQPASRKRRGSPSSSTTPPTTPPASRFMLKLPPSRPPSPTGGGGAGSVAADCRALFQLVNTLPRPSADKQTTRLAREAVDEAFEGLQALGVFLDGLQKMDGKSVTDVVAELQTLTREIPTLIALPPLLRMFCPRDAATVSGMLGLSEEEYRRGILTGFGRAEDTSKVRQK
ncbi:hypothetical protein CC1G_07348 [Coprinopsis cinerea okayama7|uniref:Uncharacterized protein n=1 Tax=Coprinopsis cinerea (strain Okayama-7 / 130 / ATCC MYA-4618 / FGSC 9003) TaxID=240176 RepID=A8N6H5_COPC7|nr:hypothetical protein CC1G_07348 [Coprinopsis cinerea okayama7\|eukprot:XP_001830433.2 hypothetical protein CC1G_07348 [Coprinopsis cinerea okayama7\